jgi:hypothetical protein
VGGRSAADSYIEYGVQARKSKTILLVTTDAAEAEHTLDLLGEGRLVQRTVCYSPWFNAAVRPSDTTEF